MLSKPAIDTSLGRGCPETPLLAGSQVTDSVHAEFTVLDAHKEMFLARCCPFHAEIISDRKAAAEAMIALYQMQ